MIHIDLTSDKLLNNIYELVKRTTQFVLSPCLIILSKLLFLFPLILGLAIYKPYNFGCMYYFYWFYFVLYKTFRNRLFMLGKLESEATKQIRYFTG